MIGAAKKKSLSPVSLAAVRVLVLLVVTLCLGQTRVWGFGITAQPASGVFESVNPLSIGENTIGSGYDASDSPHAARGTPQLVLPAPSVVPNAGGVIRSFIQETDQVYYRVSSGSPSGSFLTSVKPSSSAFSREALALPEANTASFIQEVLVPAGTRLQRSRAIPAFGRRGGAEQFEILKLKPGEYQPVQFGENVPFP